MKGSERGRGGCRITSESGGLKDKAVAGRPSVTRLTHRSCTGTSASGMPRAAVRKIHATSPMLEEIRYRMNALVFMKMALPSSTAETIVEKLSSASTMSAAVLATAVPEPMATPMFAFLSAGASLTPSPVIATTMPCRCNSSTSRSLCNGSVRAKRLVLTTASSAVLSSSAVNSRPVRAQPDPEWRVGSCGFDAAKIPTCRQSASAVALLSPVTTTTRMPASAHVSTALHTSGRGGSLRQHTPTRVRPDSISANWLGSASGSEVATGKSCLTAHARQRSALLPES
mmetsp:Transcript_50994/g.84528  ORF Transcript_50994/g.84528 Transcript_50994/m.84528 type:complete len:285 (+) Transcript_50994:864-1718(+)